MSAVPGGAVTSIASPPRGEGATTAILARGATADADPREGDGGSGAFARELQRIDTGGRAPFESRTGPSDERARRVVPAGEGDRAPTTDADAPPKAAIVAGAADRGQEPLGPDAAGGIPSAIAIDEAVPPSGEPSVEASGAERTPVANEGSAVETVVPVATVGDGPVVSVASTPGSATAAVVGDGRSDDAAAARETDSAEGERRATDDASRPIEDARLHAMATNAGGRDTVGPLADRHRAEDVSDAAVDPVDTDDRHPRPVSRTDDRSPVERPAPSVLPAVPASVRRALADGLSVPRRDASDASRPMPPAVVAPAAAEPVPAAVLSDDRQALPLDVVRALRSVEAVPAERAVRVDALLEASASGGAPRTLPGDTVAAPPAMPSSVTVPTAAAPAVLATRSEASSPAVSIAPQTVPLDGAGGAAEALTGGVRWAAGEGRGQAWINIAPAALGPLAIRVSVEGEQVSVSIAASQAGAREALEPLIPRLREQLAADGHQSVNVDLSGGREDPRASADGRDARAGADAGGRSASAPATEGDDERNARPATEARRMPEGAPGGAAGGHALVDAWA